MTISKTGATGGATVRSAPPAGGAAAVGADGPLPYLVQTPKSMAAKNAEAVEELQRRLKAAGFDPGPTDGWLGPKTAAALKAYQQSRGLVVDGEAGPQTWGAMGLQGAPRAKASPPAAPGPTPNQGSNLGLPPAGVPTNPSDVAPVEGPPHETREAWFLSQQRGIYNPNEDVLGNGNCGPAAVTMVARAFGKIATDAAGVDAAVEESRRRVGDGMDEKQGTSIAGLQRALRSYGLEAEVKSSPRTIDLIAGELAQGKLVIAHVKATYLWGPNARTGHYTVVTAIKDGRVYLNDSSSKTGPIDVSIAEFERAIAARGTYTIISARP